MGKIPGTSPEPKKQGPSNYLRYSSLAIQMLLTLIVAGWLGHKLDIYLDFRFPLFMLLFGGIAFFGLLYRMYLTLKRDE